MRGLFDENVSHELKTKLGESGHECFTVQECGWAGKTNGELRRLAEIDFDALLTLTQILNTNKS
jgi:hypothetical protein